MLHHLLHTTLWVVGYFLGGIVTLSVLKLFHTDASGLDNSDDTKMQIVFFLFWPLVVTAAAIVITGSGLYTFLKRFKYLNPLYLSDKLSNVFKPTFNLLKYKWTQRGLNVKNDWSNNG